MNGREMSRARKKVGFTQEQFGKEFGLRRETINRWERSWKEIPKAYEIAVNCFCNNFAPLRRGKAAK